MKALAHRVRPLNLQEGSLNKTWQNLADRQNQQAAGKREG